MEVAMISKKLVLGISLILGASGASPAQAHKTNTATRLPSAAVVAPVNSLQLLPQRYCIVEAIHSRIPQRICKTALEWSAEGVDLEKAR
jgi:hypothetical protein